MTTLYIIRHGIAAEPGAYASDGDRPLTDKGRHRTQQVAERLAKKVHVALISTSPLVRAQQTAEILLETGVGDRLQISEYLSPGGDFHQWLDWLAQWSGETLAIVGHQPDLGIWAERLLWGDVRGCLEVKKASVLGLSLPEVGSPEGRSGLFWLTPPRLLLD
ncbi:MAG: phosphohistidine phosphatase SixA [Elainellaceae cyanobacterium]